MKLNHLVVLAVGSLNYFSFQSTFAEETTQVPKVSNEKKKHKFTNRLINEKSPYLLQHAHNPVDWYPWGEEAFEKAQKEDKPIFLSIGYSSCHWCHVMEKESFEDLETAEILNKNFVSIKVDREERPDIDSVYMAAIQMINGNGGWPASIFMNNKGIPCLLYTSPSPRDRG